MSMDKSFAVIALFVSALCFSSALARKTPVEGYVVRGKIFCEPCRFEIESGLSSPLSGVNLTLECAKNGHVTYTREGVSGKNGMYSIPVHGDHDEETCVVIAKIPSKGLCNDALSDKKSDKIVLAKKKGVHHSSTRLVNPLGFMTKTIDPKCDLAADELALDNLYDG